MVTELHVKKNFGNKENVDVDFTAATYYKKAAGGGAGGKPAAGGGEKPKEG